ncbi:MAG: aminotransferase class V-fold PLP-dependent enzyme [Oscillospiraceae bacterium]
MVNFDNSATTYPKPLAVRKAVNTAMVKYGGNPGRSGHRLSMETAEAVYTARIAAADFFGAEPDCTIFTANCTHALNTAIKGVIPDGSHIIISDLEHNSVARPVYAMKQRGCTFDIFHVYPDKERTLTEMTSLIKPNTAAVVCTLGSNVTGRITPYRDIGRICRKRGICFIADGAQMCGIMDVKLSDGINILCTAGHKSLYGPSGTGLLLTDGQYKIKPLTEGGTGSTSLELKQPDFLPDSLESGTVNTMGIIGLGAGIDFVKGLGTNRIFDHETALCRRLMNGLSAVSGVKVYRDNDRGEYLPIVSFNLPDMTANDAASRLSDMGYALRGGLHCSGLAHKSIGTLPEGTVRFSPSVFSTAAETDGLIRAIKKICGESRTK